MTYVTLDDVRAALRVPKLNTPEWAAKMLHDVPELPTIPDRQKYLVEKTRGRAVLDIGCAGKISAAIRASASEYYGVDKDTVDLDERPDGLPKLSVDAVIVSEVLEHLANPGRFLRALHATYAGIDTYISVPNAGAYRVHNGTHEIVNGDHVAWYSYTTLKTLLGRYGYPVVQARWYHGEAHTAEGLLVLTR